MKLKICGMRDPSNIMEVSKLLPDYMGFIFYEKSPRYVGENFVIPEMSHGIKKTGVFVNECNEKIISIVNKFGLKAVQLHGNETAEQLRDLKKHFTTPNAKTEIIKAFGIHNDFDFDTLCNYQNICNYFLFDTATKNYGGSGKTFDWKILNNYNHNIPFFLSGGIDMADVKKSSKFKVQSSKFYAIDVNSKFEIEPGIKNIEKLKTFIHELFCR